MKKILLIEDDVDISLIVEYFLRSIGFDVCTHFTGLNVPEVISKYKPHLILLDIFLPGKLGTEVCKEIKLLYTTPVILFSAHVNKAEAFAECNPDGFIEKPFTRKDLLNTIKSYLIDPIVEEVT